MEDVHGIAVAGATYPSYIWHEFMLAAVGNQPYRDFPEPTHPAVYRYWEKGTKGRSFGYSGYYSGGYSSGYSSTTTEATTTAPAATAAPPAAPPGQQKKHGKTR